MNYAEYPKYNPEWEGQEFVFLDRKNLEIEMVYVETDTDDTPMFISEICSFNEFCNCVHDALESCGEFSEYYEMQRKKYPKKRDSKYFDDMCDFLASSKPDFVFDTKFASQTWTVMTVFSEVYSILRGVRE